MKTNKLILEQLDKKIIKLNELGEIVLPPNGWIYSIRKAINMSLRQLGKRLNITPQSVKEIEEREKNGTISIKVLKQVANALDMKLVYGFVPNDKSLENMVEKRATELAEKIVLRTSTQMNLEEQKVSDDRLKKAIKQKTEELKNEMPRFLWD